MTESEAGRTRARAGALFAIGAIVWTAALLARWPVGLSFGDEIGYVGQMRLVLQGRLHPLPSDVGVWVSTAHGEVAKYPYFLPILEAPLFAAAPRLVFLPGVVAALAAAFIAGRALRSWGRSPAWGLLLLAYPPLVLMARTAMTDLVLTAAILGAWWSVRQRRIALAAVLIAATVAVKTIGFGVACMLLTGEALRDVAELRARNAVAWRRYLSLSIGLAVGLGISMGLNLAANGTLFSVYDAAHAFTHEPAFSPAHFRASGTTHLASLLLMPPLLVVGIWPLWRRREYGPVVLIAGLVGSMCFYLFVDTGRSFAQTLILSPRLILPAAAFLLIGYAEIAGRLAARLPPIARALAVPAALLPGIVAVAISVVHQRWLREDGDALASLSAFMRGRPASPVAVVWPTAKAGMLYPGPISQLDLRSHPEVILCGTRSPSYRDPNGHYSCDFPGYEVRVTRGSFQILTPGAPASPPRNEAR